MVRRVTRERGPGEGLDLGCIELFVLVEQSSQQPGRGKVCVIPWNVH